MAMKQKGSGQRMWRPGRFILIALAGLVLVWLIGHLLLDVQFPDRGNGRWSPVVQGGSLYEVFETLPAEVDKRARLTILDDNTTAWVVRWRLLADARERLDISYFILKQDLFGVAFLGHLAHKARQGLRIRVLLDAMGTKMGRNPQGNDYLDTLVRTKNVTVKMYRPLYYRYLDAFLTLNPAAVIASDHDKVLLADGVRGLIGGRNIASEYFTDLQESPLAFRDVDVLLTGPDIGAALETTFETQYEGGEAHAIPGENIDIKDSSINLELAYAAMDAWLSGKPVPEATAAAIRERNLPWLDELAAVPQLRGALHAQQPKPVRAPVRLLDSPTRLLAPDDHISRSLIQLARSAQEEIFIQTPYLVLPDAAIDLFADIAKRGVRITILTNSSVSTDNALSQAFFLEQWPELMARVPTLRLFVAGDRHNLHSKAAVIDGRLALIGTYNLDPLSIALNSELVAAVWSAPFAEQLLKTPRGLIAAGSPQTYEYRIARDSAGWPKRNADGRVIVAFGPTDHSTPDQRVAVERYRTLLRGAETLFGVEPLF